MSDTVYQFTFSDEWTNTDGTYSGSLTFDGYKIVGTINVVSPFGAMLRSIPDSMER